MQEVEDEQEENDHEEELDAGRVQFVFKYARPSPSNLCTATNILKSFLRPLPPALVPFRSNCRGRAEKKTIASRGRAMIITRMGRSPGERQREREKQFVRGHVGRTKRSREPKNIFKNLNHLLKTTGPTRTRRYDARLRGASLKAKTEKVDREKR